MLGVLATVALWALLLTIAVLLLVIALPVIVDCRLGNAKQTNRFRFKLLAGLTPWIKVPSVSSQPKPLEDKTPSRRRRPSRRQMMSLVEVAPKAIRWILAPIYWDHVLLDLKFGLADPAATGELYGYMTPIVYGGAQRDRFQIYVKPNFTTTQLEVELDARLRLIPLMWVPPAILVGWQMFRGRA